MKVWRFTTLFSKRNTTFLNPFFPVTLSHWHWPWVMHILQMVQRVTCKKNSLQSSSIYNFPKNKRNLPCCVSFETKCTLFDKLYFTCCPWYSETLYWFPYLYTCCKVFHWNLIQDGKLHIIYTIVWVVMCNIQGRCAVWKERIEKCKPFPVMSNANPKLYINSYTVIVVMYSVNFSLW